MFQDRFQSANSAQSGRVNKTSISIVFILYSNPIPANVEEKKRSSFSKLLLYGNLISYIIQA